MNSRRGYSSPFLLRDVMSKRTLLDSYSEIICRPISYRHDELCTLTGDAYHEECKLLIRFISSVVKAELA